jgi:hypothetical protein
MKFLGSIQFIEYEKLNLLIHELYLKESIRFKIRALGEEINVDSETIELYIYGQHHEKKYFLNGRGHYLVQGNIKEQLLESLIELNRLMQGCQKAGYHYIFDIYPDPDDEGLEMHLRSPGYDLYMDEMNKKLTDGNIV